MNKIEQRSLRFWSGLWTLSAAAMIWKFRCVQLCDHSAKTWEAACTELRKMEGDSFCKASSTLNCVCPSYSVVYKVCWCISICCKEAIVCHIRVKIFSLHISDLVVYTCQFDKKLHILHRLRYRRRTLGRLIPLTVWIPFWNMEQKSLSFFLHDYNQGVDCLEMEESQATRWVYISSYIPCWKKQSTKREYYRKREDLAAIFSWLGIFFPPFLVKLKLLIVCIKEENDFASSLKIKALTLWSLEYSISFQFDLYINKPQNCDIILFMRKCIRMEQKKAFC